MLERDMRKDVVRKWPLLRITPIESGGTRRSIPDMHLRSFTADWWVELKRQEGALTEPIEVPWRPGQLTWLKNHEAMGGHSALILTRGFWFYIILHTSNMKEQYSTLDELISYAISGPLSTIPDDIWEIR